MRAYHHQEPLLVHEKFAKFYVVVRPDLGVNEGELMPKYRDHIIAETELLRIQVRHKHCLCLVEPEHAIYRDDAGLSRQEHQLRELHSSHAIDECWAELEFLRRGVRETENLRDQRPAPLNLPPIPSVQRRPVASQSGSKSPDTPSPAPAKTPR